MLILARRCGEEIVIDQQVRLRVIRTTGNRVTVEVIAPPDVPVRRCKRCDDMALDCGPILVPETEPVVS